LTASLVCEQNPKHNGVLFIGVFIPLHRGLDILTNLSPNRLGITSDKEDSQRG
jgi:hypothetical protein